MSNGPLNLLTRAEVEALPALGPWHVAACHTHVPGGQFYRPGEPAPTCVAVRDAAGRPVESPQAALELQAAAPALRSTALALYAEVERLRALAYPVPLPLSYSAGDDPPSLWWQSAPIKGPPDYVGTPGDSGWPFTAEDEPIWIPMPAISADKPRRTE